MNTTDPDSNITSTSGGDSIASSILTTTTAAAAVLQPPSHPSDIHDPEFTIMVVLGLSLLLAGLAAFLAVRRRRSEPDGESERSRAPGERLTRGRSSSTEPQLKKWRRLGSYRRSHNLSFRRPPYRRPLQPDRARASQSVASQTPRPEPHITTPCLLDYVTEI